MAMGMQGALAVDKGGEEPLFRSAHEALRFAYAYSSQQYPVTIMGRLMGGGGMGSGRGLFGLDGAGEAGNVKRIVGTLPGAFRHAIAARYTINAHEVVAAACELVPFVIPALGTGVHHRRMVQDLICRFFGAPGADGGEVKLAALADRFDVDASTVTRKWQRVRSFLYGAERGASMAAEDAMIEAGLVVCS